MRRIILAALVATAIVPTVAPEPAEARGMCCSRHRAECARRRAAEAAAAAAYAAWYEGLNPLDRAREDLRMARLDLERQTAEVARLTTELDSTTRELQAEKSRREFWFIVGLFFLAMFLLMGGLFANASAKIARLEKPKPSRARGGERW